MLITFEELRNIKHSLPAGSIRKIAKQLNVEEQSIRNFFGAKKTSGELPAGWHKQAGPNGGVIKIESPIVLEYAQQMIADSKKLVQETRRKIDDSRQIAG